MIKNEQVLKFLEMLEVFSIKPKKTAKKKKKQLRKKIIITYRNTLALIQHTPTKKNYFSGKNPIMSTMNKSKKDHISYRGRKVNLS